MKQLKIALLGIASMLLLFFFAFIPMRAEAATIENGKNTKLLQSGQQFYKFTLSDDSLVQVYWSNNTKNGTAITLYVDKDKKKMIDFLYPSGQKTGKEFYALKKGTYYVDMYDYYQVASVKITWNVASKYDKQNYCMAKATTLNKDTIANVVQTPRYDYSRWYRIKLTKAQKVTILSPYGNGGFVYLYSPSWQSYQFSTADSTNKVTTDKLAAGTYYIRVAMDGSYYQGVEGSYIAFKWK